jgi:ribose 5-phosphate isomerase A
MSRELKIAAARAALDHVADGMLLGIGTGSTAEEFVALLAERVASGLKVTGVATSERTQALCLRLGVPMTTLDRAPELDLTVDGADEIGPGLALIKGGGGALLREKIVAAASKRMVVIADESKLVERLGAYPLPIEVNEFGLAATQLAIRRTASGLGLECSLQLRHRDGKPFISDGGHLIVDASFGLIRDAEALSLALLAIPGIVEHGLFIDMAETAIIASRDGVRSIGV